MEKQNQWRVGQISEHYESRGRGPGTISTGQNDHGGASYGIYQLSSKTGTLEEYLDQSAYGEQFKGMTQATPAFDSKWRDLAQTDPKFGDDQQAFIASQLYKPQIEKLKDRGLDFTDRGPAVQEALWSTSVQMRSLTPGVFANGLREKFGADYKLSELTDKEVVGAVQDYKIAHNEQLFKSSKALWPALRERAENEKTDLLAVADGKFTGYAQGQQTGVSAGRGSASAGSVLKHGDHSEAVGELQSKLSGLGYTGADNLPLVVDKRYGPATERAVEKFQHEHHLRVDGKVGPKTMEALVQDMKAANEGVQSSKPLLSDPEHPDHKLFCQAKEQVYLLDASFKRAPDERSDNLAAALTVGAKAEQLRGIHSLVLSDDRSKAFVVDDVNYSNAFKRFAGVAIVPAMSQSIEQSTQQIAQVNAAHEQTRAQQLTVATPSHEAIANQPAGKSM